MNSSSENVVSVNNLTVSFNGFTAVDNISFNVGSGEVLGILGSNGAGKSSTMKVLSGIIKPQEGSVTIDDYLLTSIAEEEEAKKLLGYCPDVGGLVVGATPREHIQLLLALDGRESDYDKGLYLVEQIGLSEFLDTPVGGFSHGMSRRLSVVLATLASKRFLILDEPFDGVDPIGVESIVEIISEAKRMGLAVVVCTHLLSLLTEVTDRVIVMRKGVILDTLPVADLKGDAGAELYKSILESPEEDVVTETDVQNEETDSEEKAA